MTQKPGSFSAFISYSCYNKAPQIGWLKQQKCYFLTVLDVSNPRSRSWQGWFPLSHPDFFLRLHMVFSLCVCVQISLFYKDTTRIKLEPTLMALLTSLSLERLYPQQMSRSEVQRVRTPVCFLPWEVDTIQVITTSTETCRKV